MANYAILRAQKLKSGAAVYRSMKHSFREQETPNAIPELLGKNEHFYAESVKDGMAAFRGRLPASYRKDAVQCIEYLMTASPEAMRGKSRQEQDAYLLDGLRWLRERHGAENVVYAGIHRDETTPHMYAYVVPIDASTGRLNAKKWLGGAKALSQMQTEFARDVGAKHGLVRGIERSKARHTRIQEFYAALEERQGHVTIAAEELKPRTHAPKGLMERIGLVRREETPEEIASRLNSKVRENYETAVTGAAGAREMRRKLEQYQANSDVLAREKNRTEVRLTALQWKFELISELERLRPDAYKQLMERVQLAVETIHEQKEQERRQEQATEKQPRSRDYGHGLEL